MAIGDENDIRAFEAPLPAYHEESHPLLLTRAPLPLVSDFEDPADRLTVCELPRKSLLPLS